MWPKGLGFRVLNLMINNILLDRSLNYLLIYLEFTDQIIENHDKRRDLRKKIVKSCVPKVVPWSWMAPKGINNPLSRHFILATYILLSFCYMACNFITSARVNSNGLSTKKDVAHNWAWCWAFANLTLGRGLSSTSQESKDSTLRSKLGGSILYPTAISTTSFDMQYCLHLLIISRLLYYWVLS